MQYRSITFSVSLIFLFIAGCATSYQPANWRGYGFSEKQLSEQSYMVAFRGNEKTSPNRVQQMLLRRCAELTVLNGYSYFLIVDEESDRSASFSESESNGEYGREGKHIKSVQIFMAKEKEISPEGRQKAINAGVYLRGK